METIFHFVKKEGLGYKSSLTPPLLIEMTVPSQEIEQSCICVLGVSILFLSTIFLLHFRTVTTVWYFLFFYYILEVLRQCGILCFS
jgi:hypothetical protein